MLNLLNMEEQKKSKMNQTLNEFGPNNSSTQDISGMHHRQYSNIDMAANKTNHFLPIIGKEKNRVRFLNHSADHKDKSEGQDEMGGNNSNMGGSMGNIADMEYEGEEEDMEPKMY